MDNEKLIYTIRYYLIVQMVAGIIVKNTSLPYLIIAYIFVFIINNHLMVYSITNKYLRVAAFILEFLLIILGYEYIGGYLFAYLILATFDSNIIFNNPYKLIFDGAIIFLGIFFSINSSLEVKFITIGMVICTTLILYYVEDQKDRKIKAQVLYDKLRVSEEKLQKANKELEIYAGSIEELTLLRERNRISREIHDSVGHSLSTMVIQLGAIEKTIDKNAETAKSLTMALREFTKKSLNEVRMAVREIKPKEFENYEGILVIEELIKSFKKLTGVDVRFSFTKEKWPINQDQAFVLYRIVQEFLVNSVRHGNASIVHIMMAYKEYKLAVTLKDNGVGCDNVIEGIGLKGMRERVIELGGSFDYFTKAKEGFLVKLEFDRKEKLKIHSQGEI